MLDVCAYTSAQPILILQSNQEVFFKTLFLKNHFINLPGFGGALILIILKPSLLLTLR